MHPSDMAQLRSQLVAIRGKLQDWSSLIPNCLALGQLQIGKFTSATLPAVMVNLVLTF